MALGALPDDILSSTILQGARLVATGLALGIGSTFELSRLISKFLYGVSPSDAASGLLAAALLAAFVPARRAAAVDPIVALRYE